MFTVDVKQQCNNNNNLEFILNGPKIDENDEFLSVVFQVNDTVLRYINNADKMAQTIDPDQSLYFKSSLQSVLRVVCPVTYYVEGKIRSLTLK